MRRPAALFPIVLALGAIILAPRAGAQAQDAREEGPTEIKKCQTISQPGSYKLVNNLTFTGTTGTCLTITASSVTIDLAGFTISGRGFPFTGALTAAGAGIAAANDTMGIAVRNGSIAGFSVGVALDGDGSLVEGLRVFGSGCPCSLGIGATGVVKGNTVLNIVGFSGQGVGIFATGIITGNYVTGSRIANLKIGQGSSVALLQSGDEREVAGQPVKAGDHQPSACDLSVGECCCKLGPVILPAAFDQAPVARQSSA